MAVHFFRKKILYNMTVSYFWNWINYYQIQQFVYKHFVLKICFFIIPAIKEFIFKNWKRSSCRESFSLKNEPWFIRIASFLKIWLEAIIIAINNNIATVKSKIIYFCLRSNFRDRTTLILRMYYHFMNGKKWTCF